MRHGRINPSAGHIEQNLYKTRPDLWGLSKALEKAPAYRQVLWALLSEADQEALKLYGASMRRAGKENPPGTA